MVQQQQLAVDQQQQVQLQPQGVMQEPVAAAGGEEEEDDDEMEEGEVRPPVGVGTPRLAQGRALKPQQVTVKVRPVLHTFPLSAVIDPRANWVSS